MATNTMDGGEGMKISDFNKLLGITESYNAPAALWKILSDKKARESKFMEFLEAFDYDVTIDWFHQYFQDEHADRKEKKQDFTPDSVAYLVSQLVGNSSAGSNTFYEPAAGTGGITIKRWNDDRMQHSPFEYTPSMYLYTCEELSERTIPFLLFNLSIRGMNACVVHCDVLRREAWGAWLVQNDRNDHMMFSNIYRLPYDEATEKFLAVKFVEKKYPIVDEPGELPKWLFGELAEKKQLSFF